MAFRAEFPGVCAACASHYVAGTLLVRAPEQALHVDGPRYQHAGACPDPLAVDHPPCPDCFLVHPPGTCDR